MKKKPRGATGCSDAFQSKRCKKKLLAQLLLQQKRMSSSRSNNSLTCYLLGGCCNHALTFQRKVINLLKCRSNTQTGQIGSYFIISLPQKVRVKVSAVFFFFFIWTYHNVQGRCLWCLICDSFRSRPFESTFVLFVDLTCLVQAQVTWKTHFFLPGPGR